MRAISSRRCARHRWIEAGDAMRSSSLAARRSRQSWRSGNGWWRARRHLRRMGHGQDLQPLASRARRSPTAAAGRRRHRCRPRRRSRVGAEAAADSTTFSARMKRDNSPPEATFIKGPGSVPGLVRPRNATRSMPLGRGVAGVGLDPGDEAGLSSLSGASSAATAWSSRRAAAFARLSSTERQRS